jgi:hypothetical protein
MKGSEYCGFLIGCMELPFEELGSIHKRLESAASCADNLITL